MRLMIVALGLASTASWGLAYVSAFIGRRFGILDHPDNDRKLHVGSMPRTGGLGVCVTFLVSAVAISGWEYLSGSHDLYAPYFVPLLVLSMIGLCLIGLWDDKHGMRAITKFVWQLVLILPFVCWGRSSLAVNLCGWHIENSFVTVPLILFWLVSCSNFVNLIDGLDGLAGTVGLIIAVAVAALAELEQLPDVSLLATILAGALLGFLAHNWPPARIFLGDCGSLPLGFLVGALESSAKKAAGLTLAVPFVLLSIPMFDTSMAILRRKLTGRNIGQGDRAHIHHCLCNRGLSPKQALLAVAGLCGVTAAGTILSAAFQNEWIAVGTCAVLLAFLIVSRVFGFDETMLLVRHMQAITDFFRGLPRALRARFVLVSLGESVAGGRLDVWHRIVRRARRLPGAELEFACVELATGREIVSLTWTAPATTSSETPNWSVAYSVPRSDRTVTRASARGYLGTTGDALPFAEIAELLSVLCRNWPIHGAAAAEQIDDEPTMLPGPWAKGSAWEPDVVAGKTIESDAA
jgi:UDP-GlcNAc:undecaprenyl-phosphate GlcNAc-1-phosphate transferase